MDSELALQIAEEALEERIQKCERYGTGRHARDRNGTTILGFTQSYWVEQEALARQARAELKRIQHSLFTGKA